MEALVDEIEAALDSLSRQLEGRLRVDATPRRRAEGREGRGNLATKKPQNEAAPGVREPL